VSLVAILDADKEGYLRSYRSLIQTAGRAARHLEGRVIFYGDLVTDSMKQAIEETNRRRKIQAEYNRVHGITPVGITKSIPSLEYAVADMDYVRLDLAAESLEQYGSLESTDQLIERLESEMKAAAKELAFERAAELRNHIRSLRLQALNAKS
jgi:excinuclease ABC subunit B